MTITANHAPSQGSQAEITAGKWASRSEKMAEWAMARLVNRDDARVVYRRNSSCKNVGERDEGL
jgi:hypothetical protein